MPEYAICAWVKVRTTIIIEAETADNALTRFLDGDWVLEGDEE